jgi:uncharacterized protein (TIGR02145 family)
MLKRFPLLAILATLALSCSTGGNDDSPKAYCEGLEYNPETHFCDTRDGRTYKFAKIGVQTWMAENLSYPAISGNSWCYGEGCQVCGKTECYENYYDEDGEFYNEYCTCTQYINLNNEQIQANCSKCGRLYDWETAKKACPTGWHLPTKADFDKLLLLVDSEYSNEYEYSYSSSAGKNLKAIDGWYKNRNGTDDYGFTALPCGAWDYKNYRFEGYGYQGFWWSSSGYDENRYYTLEMEAMFSTHNEGADVFGYIKSYGCSVPSVA